MGFTKQRLGVHGYKLLLLDGKGEKNDHLNIIALLHKPFLNIVKVLQVYSSLYVEFQDPWIPGSANQYRQSLPTCVIVQVV